MLFSVDMSREALAQKLSEFIALLGVGPWEKRIKQLDSEQEASPYLWMIVSDYHWLEIALARQQESCLRDGALRPQLDDRDIASLRFSAAIVEVHSRLSKVGKRELEGRLRDCLGADSGFAPLYLEVHQALLLMDQGFDVRFPELEKNARYDLAFEKDGFLAAMECKSLSADAGRRVHRKDFYRLIDAMNVEMEKHFSAQQHRQVIVTLKGRLSPNITEQSELRNDLNNALRLKEPSYVVKPTYRIEEGFVEVDHFQPPKEVLRGYESALGQGCHVAGVKTENAGCIIVLRSEKDDDTSKPWLAALRAASEQLPKSHPSFIAVQFQDVAPIDLMSQHLRRRAGILAYALYGHYGARHVNGVTISGYDGLISRPNGFGFPAFEVPNQEPLHKIPEVIAASLRLPVSDADFASLVGATLPKSSISEIEF